MGGGTSAVVNVNRQIRRQVRKPGLAVDLVADVNAVVSTNSPSHQSAHQPTTGGAVSETRPEGLNPEELDAETGEELPDREQMSLVNANVAIPVNAAIAANVLSDGAIAYADATQDTPIDQSN